MAELEVKRGWSWWQMEAGSVTSLLQDSLKELQTDAFQHFNIRSRLAVALFELSCRCAG